MLKTGNGPKNGNEKKGIRTKNENFKVFKKPESDKQKEEIDKQNED